LFYIRDCVDKELDVGVLLGVELFVGLELGLESGDLLEGLEGCGEFLLELGVLVELFCMLEFVELEVLGVLVLQDLCSVLELCVLLFESLVFLL
jgi:hypothetical protein